MPSDFPRSPRFLKGALVVFASQKLAPPSRVIIFQYNPEQLTRTLATRTDPPQPSNVGAAREDVLRVLGPPVETIDFSIMLHAADQLAEPELNQQVVQFGLQPVLAALELLLYPPTDELQLFRQLFQQSTVQISPADIPLVLLALGKQRVVPVRITKFSITEELFDQRLNPIQAKVDLGMRILTIMELKENTIGYSAYLAYELQKEALGRLHHNSGDVRSIVGLLPL